MSPRPVLRVVPAPHEAAPEVRFCGYCGHRPSPEEDHRICTSCDLGMVLSAAATVAPRHDQPSLIVDQTLGICAVSRAAEALLGVDEPDIVGRSLAELLVPAQAEGVSLDTLVGGVLAAASAAGGVERAVVRPAGEWGIRYAVRMGACGPPRAVVLVLDDDEV